MCVCGVKKCAETERAGNTINERNNVTTRTRHVREMQTNVMCTCVGNAVCRSTRVRAMMTQENTGKAAAFRNTNSVKCSSNRQNEQA